MSRAFQELDYQQTALGELTLRRRILHSLDDIEIYEVKLGDAFLMSSLFHEVEVALAHLGLGELSGENWDVVVGGLGLGYTAQAALAHPQLRTLLVLDALQPVIDWHQRGLVPLGAHLCSDPRCRLELEDFFAAALSADGFDRAEPGRLFDAILLDIDHSPRDLLHPRNATFYTRAGLSALATKLRPGGIFAMWSDETPEEDFMELIDGAFVNVRAHEVSFANPLLETTSASTVYVARKTAAG
ncbi:MAG: spermidine synthase [Chthoniobacterales bacterium]